MSWVARRSNYENLNNFKILYKTKQDDKHFNNVIHMACLFKKYQCVKYLLHRGIDINKLSTYGNSPFYYAIYHLLNYKINKKLLKLFVSKNAKIITKNPPHDCLLHILHYYIIKDYESAKDICLVLELQVLNEMIYLTREEIVEKTNHNENSNCLDSLSAVQKFIRETMIFKRKCINNKKYKPYLQEYFCNDLIGYILLYC